MNPRQIVRIIIPNPVFIGGFGFGVGVYGFAGLNFNFDFQAFELELFGQCQPNFAISIVP